MPNWVTIRIKAPFDNKEKAKELYLLALKAKNSSIKHESDDDTLCQYYIPRPKGEDYSLDWNVKHWGTKWSEIVHEATIEPEDKTGVTIVTIDMMTAWSTPEPLLDAIADNGAPEAVMMYNEAGCDFIGHYCTFETSQQALSEVFEENNVTAYSNIDEDVTEEEYDIEYKKWYEKATKARNKFFEDEIGCTMGDLDFGG